MRYASVLARIGLPRIQEACFYYWQNRMKNFHPEKEGFVPLVITSGTLEAGNFKLPVFDEQKNHSLDYVPSSN
ncbi:hypothetical protein AGMMS50239_19490 [Bacteroidia bacterium]|nr:hypothetical protein AGMMS50239_19490 [Bacteroidia bacterium]